MIYLDSCIVIYLVEKHPDYYPLIKEKLSKNSKFVISSLVMLECLVGPLKRGDRLLYKRFEQFFETVSHLELDENIFLLAAKKRAVFGLKTPDALHLAAAENYTCSEFWTNDDRLINRSEIAVNIIKG